MPPRRPTRSRLGNQVARDICDAFVQHQDRYQDITLQARGRFQRREWTRQHGERLLLYRDTIDRVEEGIYARLDESLRDKVIWVSAKAVYSALVARRDDWDLAETFFNSVTRRIFSTIGVDPMIEFVEPDFEDPPNPAVVPVFHSWFGAPTTESIGDLLAAVDVGVEWLDQAEDARLVLERLPEDVGKIDLLDTVFYRGKGAYKVGRLHTSGGLQPLVLALRNGPRGLFVDAVLLEEDDVSILFSFTRSYFLVDTPRPYDLVAFLQSILPRKRRGELYIVIGAPKHGKTELYRNLVHHLQDTDECYVHAPGIPGLVMVVFTAPTYDMVIKVIRDRLPPQKEVTPARVKERYSWVYVHDRAGRMVDAQAFELLSMPADRFSPELRDELLEQCGETVRLDGDQLVIGHAYIERRVTPMDLYVRQEEEPAARAAMIEFGRALKDLAGCGIFPGDLLLKNFGVTRHGRVAFYDYDEVGSLGDYRFRDMPEARYEEDELRPGAWFSVSPEDVFPEEFPRFLGVPADLRAALLDAHPELFTAKWWRQAQERLTEGKVVEFAPYPDHLRLVDPTQR